MRSIPDDALLRRLSEVVRRSRRVEAELVALIAEVDARRLYAREATPSMFAYCIEVLHFSEPEAVLRIRVARASRQHPMLLKELREGRLHLSGIALLAPLLTRRNRESLLRRAAHKSKEQIRELVAELSPRPDVPSAMRKLPARAGTPVAGPAVAIPAAGPLLCPDTVDLGRLLSSGEIQGALGTLGASNDPEAARPPSLDTAVVAGANLGAGVISPSPGVAALQTQGSPGGGPGIEPFAPGEPVTSVPVRPATVEPLSPSRYRVQFTASAELREKLQRLQALMRASVPDGDLAAIIDAAVTEKLERLEARRFGKTASPRKTVAHADTAPSSRHIPAPVRRAVHKRDEGRCTYQDARGKRCSATRRLEFHHHDRPFGRGGPHSVENVRLMCREHNQLLAELDYGREKMSRFRRRAVGAPEARVAGCARTVAPAPTVVGAKVAGARPPGGARSGRGRRPEGRRLSRLGVGPGGWAGP